MSKVSGAVRVVVPASSANLGSGFDSAGLALSMFDEIEASFTDKPGVQVDVDGEGRNSLPRDENHLIARVMLKTFANLSMPVQGLYLRCINRIPHGRGLGSSAAAISAAVVAARALAGTQGTRMDDQGALELASMPTQPKRNEYVARPTKLLRSNQTPAAETKARIKRKNATPSLW